MMIDKRLIGTVPGSTKYIKQNVAAQWGGLVCSVITVVAIGLMLEKALAKALTTQWLVCTALVVAAAIIGRFALTRIAAKMGFKAASKVKKVLREKIYGKVLRLGGNYQKAVSTSEVVQVAVEGVDQLEIYFGKYLPQLFYSLLAPLTLFICLSFVNFPSAVVLLFCVPLIPASIIAVQRFAKKLLAKYWGTYTELGDSFLENLQGLTTLKIYGADEARGQEMSQQAEKFRKITMKVLVMQLNSVTLMDLIAYGGAALGVIVSVTQFAKGNVGFAGCFAIILLAAEFFIPLRLLGSFFHIAMNGMAASEKIFRLLDLPEEKTGDEGLNENIEEISLQNISFSYDGRKQVLKNLSLVAKRGITAIVGKSGCGKSTVVSLVTGKSTGYTGNIMLGEQALAVLNPADVLRQVTVVRHNSYLFKGTVAENLRMANPNATDEQLWNVLQKVKLDTFLQNENGLETALMEKAANFSGGQCQRLALARALLRDTAVYIFDEATSNIDSESENDIVQVIWEIAKTKIVIMVSHRLANVVPANKIYVLEDGNLAENGGHESLISQNGVYASLYSNQHQLENLTQGVRTNA